MKNKRLNSLKSKKYLAGVLLVLVVAVLACVLKFGTLDKLKGTIKVTDAHLASVTTKLSANISDISGDAPVVSNGYDEVNYELKFRLSQSNQDRDVIITGTLDSDNGYASFKKITGNNATSTLSDDNRRIEIVIRDLPADTEITTVIPIVVNGAPNGYRVNPTFKIKESTAEDFTDVYTNPIQVNTNNLRGTVKNTEGNTVPNILVSVYKNRKLIRETYTNDNGEYIISDLNQDDYIVNVNEEIYKVVNYSNVSVSGDTVLNIDVERVYPFNIEVHKYITKVDVNNIGTRITKTYNNASLVNFPVKRLTNLNGKVYYKIVVENTGEKAGIVSLVKDELPDYMDFIEDENNGFELVDGVIYDRNLEGIELMPGERVEDSLVLTIKNTSQAREYLNRVTATGEIYEHVVYLLDGNTYREEDVLEGEKLDRIADPITNFGGWYTDPEYTNKYNYNNRVTKDLILYGKTTRKYRVEFFDKDPETGDEDPYEEKEVPAGDPVDEPDDHPNHPGYDFEYWCEVDGTRYVFSTPVNDDLKLITCYKIKKYDVNFYDYQDTLEKNIKVEYKKLIDQNEAPTFDETGYTFICWTEDKENCFDFTTPVTREINLYPKHEKLKNAVVFNDENRITTVDNIPYGDTVDPIADQGKEGHTFRCWSENRTDCFDFDTPIIETKTLYAIYDINKFLVRFIDRNPETLVETTYAPDQLIDWGNTATKPTPDPEHYGYTFVEWKKGDTTYSFDTPVKSEITLVTSYNINTYPVHFHDGNDTTTVNVQYKHTVDPISDPTKEHHLFVEWVKEDDTPFDFTTLIVEETDLYSTYEEILPPEIDHTPTMWTNQNVTATLYPNANLADNTGYSYLYKIGSNNYNTYYEPFEVSENTTITAKASKQNVESTVVNHSIINIDKLNPSITLFSLNNVNRNSAVLNINVVDNESGINYYEVYKDNVKIGEKHFECYDETEFEDYEICRSNLPAERTSTYTVTGLTQTTTYTFKVKAYDKAGNYVFSDEIEVTTTTPRIVARLIGYNNQLFTDTIDDNTGDVITPKEDKYINFESLEEAFDYEDLYDCKNVQCTIQMVTGTNESVQVLEGQNLTLDLNGKVVSGIIPEYTIKNNGDFTLIESTPEGEEPGKLVNNQGIALLNKTGCHLTLGEGYSDVKVNGSVVSITKPYVYGEVNGVKNETNGYLTIFDGKIVAPQSQTPGYGAVNGKVTGTEYSYAAVSNTETIGTSNYQAVTLNILTSPEARINNSVYYSKLGSAMNDANKGNTTIYTDDETRSIISDVQSKGLYRFIYDDTTNTLVSYSGTKLDEATSSYIVIDLTNEENDKVLSIDYTPNFTQDYIDSPSVDVQRFLTGKVSIGGSVYSIFSVSECEDYTTKELGSKVNPYRYDLNNYSFELEKGKMYYLDLAYYKYTNNTYYQYLDELTINNITLSDVSKDVNTFELSSDTSVIDYGFYFDSTDNKIKSNNQYVNKTSAAYSMIEIDLTDYEGDYYIAVNSSMQSYYEYRNYHEAALSYGAIYISDDKTSYYGTTLADYYGSSRDIERTEGMDPNNGTYGGWATYGAMTRYSSISGGKKYYLKMHYQKMVKAPEYYPTREEYENAGCSDQLIINSIDVYKKGTTQAIPVTTYEVENSIMTDLLNNSNGSFELKPDGKTISTHNSAPNQHSYTYATIDLTNEEVGYTLELDYSQTTGQTSNGYSIGPLNLTTDYYDLAYYGITNNYMGVYQKRTTTYGEEKNLVLEANRDDNCQNNECTYMFRYNLQGGFEYEIRVDALTPDTSGVSYPNVEIKDAKLLKIREFEGNYFNGMKFGSNGFGSNNTAYTPSTNYRDSFITIDLTNYEQDQELFFSGSSESYSNTRVYLTNNNRALTQEDVDNNRANLLVNNTTPYGAVILEKGKKYFLHFAGSGSDRALDYMGSYLQFFQYGSYLYSFGLSPVTEHVLSIGDPTIFTGSLDVAHTREESSYIGKKPSDEPIFYDFYHLYGFEYNAETDMYDALNLEKTDIAVRTFKFDLTDATSDKTYTFITNGGGSRNLYAIGEGEAPVLEVSAYKELYSDWKYTIPEGYNMLEDTPSFNLTKGKVYYVQVATYNDNTAPLSFKIQELNISNTTTEYNPVKEIREFNENVDTVQLLRTVTTSETLKIDYSEEVVLDLNGYDLSTSDDYVINNYGKLTLVDTKYQRKLETYDSDLAEYQEYAGLCDGCEPSEEYKLDHLMDYLDEFGIDLNNSDPTSIYTFDYTGDVQEFVVPQTGIYKLEVWGAQGGYRQSSYTGGKGGYSEGMLELKEGETVYVYVGGSGNTGGTNGGFNGGGSREEYNGGGGATDIRVEGNSLFNRIIVAGGGGSDGCTNCSGGVGGGIGGNAASRDGYGSGGSGGNQTGAGEGGSFGQGGRGEYVSGGYGGAGGGGWFGGGATTPDGSGDDDNGGGGGSGFVYTNTGSTPVAGYAVVEHFLLTGSTKAGNNYFMNHEGTATMLGNEGDGYAKITLIVGDEIEQLRANLPKTYNNKVAPSLEGMSELTNGSGTGIIHNSPDAYLTIRDVKLKVDNKYGIYNEGTIVSESSPLINVNTVDSTGIYNGVNGEIVNNGNLKIKVNVSSCSTTREYGATAIEYSSGTHELNNVTIEGKNGTGIKVEPTTELNIHSSNITMTENYGSNCLTKTFSNRADPSATISTALYDKNYSYDVRMGTLKPEYYTDNYQYSRNDGSIYNKGTVKTDEGTTISGQITNYGDLSLTDGTGFNYIYQNTKYYRPESEYSSMNATFTNNNASTTISNTDVTVNKIIIGGGSLTVKEEENENTSIAGSSTSPVILNFGTANFNGGTVSNVYNMGTLNSNNTDYGKLYNLHTMKWDDLCNASYTQYSIERRTECGKDYKGIANINGGSINESMLLNESKMVLDSVNVPTGVMNRADLTVKGNSTITGTDKSAIQNIPFVIKYWNWDSSNWYYGYSYIGFNYARTSLTIGDDDGDVNEGPTITTTNNTQAISGDCHPMGTVGMDDFEFEKSTIDAYFQAKLDKNYLYKDRNGNVTIVLHDTISDEYSENLRPVQSIEYPNNSDNLCDLKYYDGTIQNASTSSSMTDVVYIPISDMTTGYDVSYDGAGKVVLDTIDSSARNSVIDVNGTSYRSLQAAISNAPDNSTINITGNYNTANRVTIPQGKSLTINYANGVNVNSYSKEPLITNNGTLDVTGTGSSSIIGQTAFENNGTMTFSNGNFNNYFTQSNLVKNNADLTIDNVTSNRLDIISVTDNDENINLTINNGEFNSNTIYANKTNVTVNGGYFYTGESSEYYEAYYDNDPEKLQTAHTKQLFNTHNSNVVFNNFNVDNNSRYNSISSEANLGRFVDSTLDLNDSKFGGKSSKSKIYATITNNNSKSIVNVNDGEYTNLRFNIIGGGNEYYQTDGIVNGSLLVTGSGHKVNITGGKINTNDDAISLRNSSSVSVTVGTKGDLKPNSDKLNVSKTEPEIRGGSFGITESGSSYAQNNLYFYDGIFKASGDPIDCHIEEIETGYDVIFDNQKSPKEKYLDMLPLVLNYTTGKYYYDAQEAFDEANTNDQLIWTRNYTNFADTPSLVIAQDKKFSLYFSYGTAEGNRPIYYGYYIDNPSADPLSTTAQDEFIPYDGTGSITSGMSAGQNHIKINNTSYIDESTGQEVERPFIINNGDVSIYGAVVPGNGGDPILDVMSKTTAIVNNGTMKLSRFSIRNVKANKTIIENNGTMEIYRNDLISYQSNVITNNGTLDFIGDSNDTSDCYNPTFIKVNTDQSLEDAVRYILETNGGIDIHSVLSESIINNYNATMNIKYLLFDGDYTYTAILNKGTMDVQSSSIETYKHDNIETGVIAGNVIVNDGTMTTDHLNVFTEKGIINTGTLEFKSGSLDAAYETAITNSGSLTVNGGSIFGARKGIVDTGETVIDGSYIGTYGEAYNGTNYGTTTISNSSHLATYGYNYTRYNVSYNIITSCSNGTVGNKTVAGEPDYDSKKEYPNGYYSTNNAAIYVNNRTLEINDSSVALDGSMPINHFCDYTYNGRYKYYICSSPYQHGSEGGRDFTIAAIEAVNSDVTLNKGSISHIPGSVGDFYKKAIYLSGTSSLTNIEGYISRAYSDRSTVTMGTKNGTSTGGPYIGEVSCDTDYASIELYDGSLYLNQDKLCHFSDKEDDYTIYKSGGSPYGLTNTQEVIKNIEQDVSYASVRTAISSANAGETLQLTKSVSEVTSNFDIEVNKNITIDLNGNALDANLNITSGTTTITDAAYLEDNTNNRGMISNITNTSGTVNYIEGRTNTITNYGTTNVSNGVIDKINNGDNSITTTGIVLNVTGGEVKKIDNYRLCEANISNATGENYQNLNGYISDVPAFGIMTITNSTVTKVKNQADLSLGTGANINTLDNTGAPETYVVTLTGGKVGTLNHVDGVLIMDGTEVYYLHQTGDKVTINSGYIHSFYAKGYCNSTINGGSIDSVTIETYNGNNSNENIINNGTIGVLHVAYDSTIVKVLSGNFRTIENEGTLIIGDKDGVVNTNSPKVVNTNGYAITSSRYSTTKIYDGFFKSNKSIVIDTTIDDIETGYSPYIAPEYNELGALTGNYIMYLKLAEQVDTKIACVQGICYNTLQEAINASVQNYTEQDGCPEVKIGDEFYFSVELIEDLVLDPQYSLTINLNYHNINDNGYTIPENITLRNGSRNGEDLQSNISKLLSNIFGMGDDGKDIIITKMEDGNALDTAKTYNLYKYEGSDYELVKVNPDGAGKYVIGRKTTDLKPIKGRIYLNDLDSGEYKLVDNYNNELQFTIYDDGTLSPNIKENVITDLGRLSASSVATLVISIQTGVLKINYMLIAISIIAVLSIMFVLKRKSDTNNQ